MKIRVCFTTKVEDGFRRWLSAVLNQKAPASRDQVREHLTAHVLGYIKTYSGPQIVTAERDLDPVGGEDQAPAAPQEING